MNKQSTPLQKGSRILATSLLLVLVISMRLSPSNAMYGRPILDMLLACMVAFLFGWRLKYKTRLGGMAILLVPIILLLSHKFSISANEFGSFIGISIGLTAIFLLIEHMMYTFAWFLRKCRNLSVALLKLVQ